MKPFSDLPGSDDQVEASVEDHKSDAARSLGRRDLSRLPLTNIDAYKDWCDEVNDTWTDD
ncbi:MAG: hypothetical protein HKM24_06010 [Gammaproteobacteria bacterium]|nr:hypothetical protein [Gammaproteobacteria bacterium]